MQNLVAIKVKTNANHTCQECGSTELIQAHHETPGDNDSLIPLCAKCHSKCHPNVPKQLFFAIFNQPYWPNISARSLAKLIGCHSRTVIRRAKTLNIPTRIALSGNHRALLFDILSKPKLLTKDSRDIQALRKQTNMSQIELARRLGVEKGTVNRWETGKQRPSQLALKELHLLYENKVVE